MPIHYRLYVSVFRQQFCVDTGLQDEGTFESDSEAISHFKSQKYLVLESTYDKITYELIKGGERFVTPGETVGVWTWHKA